MQVRQLRIPGQHLSSLGLLPEGTKLQFGFGTKDPNNIIPIPRSSGVTFTAFKNLQRQANRVLAFIEKGRISEDGIIGLKTMAAMATIKQTMGPIFGAPVRFESTLDIAEQSVIFGNAMEVFANSKGVGETVNTGPTSSPASTSEPTPPPATPAQIQDLKEPGDTRLTKVGDPPKEAGMGSGIWLLAGVAGVAAYSFSSKNKKKSKKKRGR